MDLHSCVRRVVFLTLVIAWAALGAAVNTGCDDEPRSAGAAGTPEATAAVPAAVAATSPGTSSGPELLPSLRWVPAELPLFAGEEVAEPFSTPERGHTEWQVLRITGNGDSELLLRTDRWVGDLGWSPDGRSVTARLRSKAAGTGPPFVGGIAEFDLSGPAPAVSEILFEPMQSVQRSPDGGRIAIYGSVGGPMTPPDLFVAEHGSSAVRLEGFPGGVSLIGWAPQGDALLLTEFVTAGAGRHGGRVFFVPLTGAPLLVNHRPIMTGHEGAWSPDGTRLAFLDGGYPPGAQADLYVFDRRTGQRHLVATGRDTRTGLPRWTEVGDGLILGDELIDPVSGTVSRASSVVPMAGALWRVVSPDGQLLVAADTSDPFDPAGCGRAGAQSRNRLFLVDLATGDQRLLRDCDAAVAWPM